MSVVIVSICIFNDLVICCDGLYPSAPYSPSKHQVKMHLLLSLLFLVTHSTVLTVFPAGVIYTADVLDRETTKSYWLTVYATDRGVVPLYATIEVYVEVEDVNDNAPLTSQPIYYPAVMENSPKDVSVIQIQAQDPDSSSSEKLTYRITSGNPQNFFAINPKTGNEIPLLFVAWSMWILYRAAFLSLSLALDSSEAVFLCVGMFWGNCCLFFSRQSSSNFTVDSIAWQ